MDQHHRRVAHHQPAAGSSSPGSIAPEPGGVAGAGGGTRPASGAGHLRVSWLELFFDLVFVVVVAQLTHLLVGDPSSGEMAGAFGLLFIVWTAWFNEVAYTNLAHGISSRSRVFVLASMAGVAVMAVGLAQIPEHHHLTFCVGYALARLALTPVWIANRRTRGLGWVRPVLFGPGIAAGWLLVGFTHPHRVWFWWMMLAIAETIFSVYRGGAGAADERLSFDAGHMLERLGLFVMICFGESVALVVGALGHGPSGIQWLVAALGFVLVASLFWMFYDVTMDRVEHAVDGAPEYLREFMSAAQLMVIGGIIGVAAGIAGAIEAPRAGHEHLTHGGLVVLCGGVGMFMVGVTSLSMGAFKVLVQRTGRSPMEGGRQGRGGIALVGLAQLLRAALVPVLLIRFGAHLAPWLVLVLLSLSPLLTAVLGLVHHRRGEDPRGRPELDA